MNALSTLKAGDPVLISYGGYKSTMSKAVVEKVGKIHLTVAGKKFSISSGREAGRSGYDGPVLAPYDEERYQLFLSARRDRLAIRRCETTNWGGLPIATIHAICRLLDAASPENKEAV